MGRGLQRGALARLVEGVAPKVPRARISPTKSTGAHPGQRPASRVDVVYKRWTLSTLKDSSWPQVPCLSRPKSRCVLWRRRCVRGLVWGPSRAPSAASTAPAAMDFVCSQSQPPSRSQFLALVPASSIATTVTFPQQQLTCSTSAAEQPVLSWHPGWRGGGGAAVAAAHAASARAEASSLLLQHAKEKVHAGQP